MQMPIEKPKNKKVVIIGGGPAGLTAAYELSKVGVESIVLEKDQMVGGISRTVNYKNYYFDIGGHRFFTKVKAVEDMWKEVIGDGFLHRERLSRIYFNNRFFYYPLRPLNALFGMGLWNSFLTILSYLHAHMSPSKQEETLEQWVSNRFGKRLYRTFFKTYTEKVWGIPCSEIQAEWSEQRIKGLSLMSALKNAFIKPENNNSNGDIIKTLIDSFDYPKFGPGMMWQAVSDILQKDGSQVRLETEVEGILWDKNRIESLEIKLNGKKELVHGTHFISSMSIRELIQKFKPAVPEEVLKAANRLRYRDFLTVALIINKRDLFPDNWIYIHDPRVKLGRIQNFKNWSPYMVPDPDKTCLGLEYFCFEGDALWNLSDQELIELGKKELEILGLIQASEIEDGKVVRMPKAYPVYDAGYHESLQAVRQFLSPIDNLQLIGRNGMHKYNNQDHSMLTAMLAAENTSGANHDLWEVNTEQEYHEEIKEEPSQPSASEEILRQGFAKMDKLAFATAVGSVSGLLILIATLWLIIKDGQVVGPHLQLLGQYFSGYSMTLKGAFIGIGYSFIWGFLFGWVFAYLRNLSLGFFIYRVKMKAELLSFRDFLDNI
jgi:protoporphyrinogen oxidase